MRGLSVVNNSVAWISGSNGYTARSIDGGTTWSWNQLAGYEKFDFRDIEAFSATDAIIVSAGTPAVILATSDGGRSWQEVYRNSSPDIFLDGMDFWNRKRGIIYGDPISGKMQLLQTEDGGKTWKDISQNLSVPLMAGEASFAASGTVIRTLKNGEVFIGTGGVQSRLFFSSNYGRTWKVTDIPIIQGQSSTGPFSIAFRNRKNGIAVGGDYLKDTVRTRNLMLTNDGGVNWTAPQIPPYGYRSAIEYFTSNTVLTTGPTGTDISSNGGMTWKQLSSDGYNCVRKAKTGSLIILAGSKGKISKLTM
ncbi:oxidoreductase [Flavihumibacter sp. R14]|nr:oxidoreductase [Flavihumibacter soli]